MALNGYQPVGFLDDEDELLKNGGYAPAMPPALASAGPADAAASAPPVGSIEDLEARASQPRTYRGPDATPPAPRPQWKDYAPPEAHGWAKAGRVLGDLLTGQPSRDFARRDEAYKNATKEYEAPLAEEQTQSLTEEHQAAAERDRASAEAIAHPQAAPKEETWKTVPSIVGPGGTILQESDKGNIRWAPEIQGAAPLKTPTDKPDSLDQQYNDAIANGDHATAARILKVKEDLARAAQSPERPQRTLMAVPSTDGSGSQRIIEVTPGTVIPGTAQKPGEMASANRKDIAAHDKAYVQPADAVEKSFQMMQHAYDEYETARAQGKELPTGAQSMVALSTHLSTTFGQVKGARVTKDMIHEHLGARSISDSALVAVQRLTNGDALSPDQWTAFHDLISESRKVSWQQAAKAADRKHIPVDFLPADLQNVSHEPGDDAVKGSAPKGATMRVPGNDGKLHWSDGKQDLGLAE